MIESKDFVVFGLTSWDIEIATTIKYTAIEISKKNRVLYVNPALQRSFQIFKRQLPETQKYLRIFKGEEPDLVRFNDNLWVLYPRTVMESINWIKNKYVFDFFNKVNGFKISRQIKKAIARLGFKDCILLNDNSMVHGFYFNDFLDPKVNIYLLRDAVTLVSYHALHGTRLEPLLIAKSDIVVTNSEFFKEYAWSHNQNSHMIGQGCDVSLYSDPEGKLLIPEDVTGISHPRIGYTGYLTTIRLDIGILVYIAKTRPDWNLVLVGPEDKDFIDSELHKLPNVYFLGRKVPNSLPGYVKSFDVAINPQAVNPITDINYPLKIDEYLAMGKAIVATKTTFMNYFRNETYLASGKEEYVPLIEKALSENSPDKAGHRIRVAGSHSWENFAGKIYEQIKLLKNSS